MAVALDSSVVIAYLDREDSLHARAADRVAGILCTDTIAVSVIVYAEVVTGATLGHHDTDLVRSFFDDCVARITHVERRIADLAGQLRSRHRWLRLPDALILATADSDDDVDLVLCGETGWSKVQESISCAVETIVTR